MKTCYILLYVLGFEVFGISCNPENRHAGNKSGPPGAYVRPNILFAISDDQSYPHASAYGCSFIRTPAFDRVAREGWLFHNAFVASPGCSPSRAALLTGRNTWQIGAAGTHASSFPAEYPVYPDVLEEAGYFVGYTGKGWGPGNWEVSGRTRNPAGTVWNGQQLDPPHAGISRIDYAGNFEAFLEARPEGRPFCFWYGASEPHRDFEEGAGVQSGRDPRQVVVPAYLPDAAVVRSDLLDYAVEVEWFDHHLGLMLQKLEEIGELDNTIVVVTSDNGMSFPRAKANLYEYGIHVPLALRWGALSAGGHRVDDIVSLVDLAPTFLEAAGLDAAGDLPGTEGISLLPLMRGRPSRKTGTIREAAYSARERHSSSRWNNLGYPQRSVRTDRYLYIRNFKPERWPAGAPRKYEADGSLGPEHGGYHDIDACPTFDFLIAQRDNIQIGKFFHLAVDKRPEEELFDIVADPACLNNLVGEVRQRDALLHHRNLLGGYLMQTVDPRVTGNGDIYEFYMRYSPIRQFPPPDWAMDSAKVLIRSR